VKTPEPEVVIDPDALNGDDARSLRGNLKEIQEISDKLREENEDKVRIIESLKRELKETKEEIGQLNDQNVHLVDEKSQMATEHEEIREKLQSELDGYVNDMEAQVNLKLKKLIQPYEDSYNECQSLKAVLEMKNAELKKLKHEASEQKMQKSDNLELKDMLERLKNENEHLEARLSEKSNDIIHIRNDLETNQTDLNQSNRELENCKLQIEQLNFKLVDSPKSPNFNPIFSQSVDLDSSTGSGMWDTNTTTTSSNNNNNSGNENNNKFSNEIRNRGDRCE